MDTGVELETLLVEAVAAPAELRREKIDRNELERIPGSSICSSLVSYLVVLLQDQDLLSGLGHDRGAGHGPNATTDDDCVEVAIGGDVLLKLFGRVAGLAGSGG